MHLWERALELPVQMKRPSRCCRRPVRAACSRRARHSRWHASEPSRPAVSKVERALPSEPARFGQRGAPCLFGRGTWDESNHLLALSSARDRLGGQTRRACCGANRIRGSHDRTSAFRRNANVCSRTLAEGCPRLGSDVPSSTKSFHLGTPVGPRGCATGLRSAGRAKAARNCSSMAFCSAFSRTCSSDSSSSPSPRSSSSGCKSIDTPRMMDCAPSLDIRLTLEDVLDSAAVAAETGYIPRVDGPVSLAGALWG